MSRVAWLTDIHLNFLLRDGREASLQRVAAEQPTLCCSVATSPKRTTLSGGSVRLHKHFLARCNSCWAISISTEAITRMLELEQETLVLAACFAVFSL